MSGMVRKKGGFCVPSALIRGIGLVLIVVGALILLIFVPLRYWLALLGLALLLAGIALRVLF